MTSQAQYWIDTLRLLPHPEGGYFRETYRAESSIAQEALPAGFDGPRSISTAIYFLLDGENFSAFHRLRSDEVWHFYAGTPLLIHVIKPGSGEYAEIELGADLDRGQAPQAVVRAGWWFACRVRDPESFALVGCTVAPGFDFADFEMARRGGLIQAFPQHQELIERFTRS
jgi:predicted cupin superfamily sugar epimerase